MSSLPTSIVSQLIAETYDVSAHPYRGFVVGFNMGVDGFKEGLTCYLDLMLVGKALPTLLFRRRWQAADKADAQVTAWEIYSNHNHWRSGITRLLDSFADRIVCLDARPGCWYETVEEPFKDVEPQ